MAITSITDVPEDIKSLWRQAEDMGYSDLVYIPGYGLMGQHPQHTNSEDERILITLDTFLLHRN